MKQTYKTLHKAYGSQGWWTIINNETLLCEYHTKAPRNEQERFEILIGSILAQNTQWYPDVIRNTAAKVRTPIDKTTGGTKESRD